MSDTPAASGAPAPRSWLWSDLAAGLCVAGLLLPEAVAYAGLAHLPARHALVAAMVGLAIYALWGGSRFAVVAPTSSSATLAAAAVLSTQTGAPHPQAYLPAFSALVLLAGGILALLAWARQGQLSAFVSRPVLRGFAFALAITIVIKQLPDALGLALPHGSPSDPWHVLSFVVAHPSAWHGPSVAVAAVAALLVAWLRRFPRLPGSLLVIALAISATRGWDLHAMGVAEVGAIERPGFEPIIPSLPVNEWLRLGELAFGLVVLVFAESWGSIRTLALAHNDHVDANRELLVLGACNLGSALLQGLPVGAGFSASSANAAAGANSRRAGMVALLAMAVMLAWALPALQFLPRPVLAVAVISALWHALSPRPLHAAWAMRRDRLLIVAAVVAVLFLGVLDGMLAAIGLSLLMALQRFSQPVVRELGELEHSRNFVELDTHTGAVVAPGLLILRPEEPLFFASAERVASEVMDRLGKALQPVAPDQQARSIHSVVLSLEESADLDSTAVECLLELDQRLRDGGRLLVLARVKDAPRAVLQQVAPEGLGAAGRMFWSVADAVGATHADVTKASRG